MTKALFSLILLISFSGVAVQAMCVRPIYPTLTAEDTQIVIANVEKKIHRYLTLVTEALNVCGKDTDKLEIWYFPTNQLFGSGKTTFWAETRPTYDGGVVGTVTSSTDAEHGVASWSLTLMWAGKTELDSELGTGDLAAESGRMGNKVAKWMHGWLKREAKNMGPAAKAELKRMEKEMKEDKAHVLEEQDK